LHREGRDLKAIKERNNNNNNNNNNKQPVINAHQVKIGFAGI
jgi:hypothetical protein